MTAPPLLTGATPYWEVFDMVASLAFYRDRLGFVVAFASPEVETAEGRFAHFVRLRHGAVELMLNTAYDSNERPPARPEPRWRGCRHVALYVDCEDVDAYHAACVARGLDAPAPAPTTYGWRGFAVSDPDGHGLTFHQPVTSS